MRIGVTGGRNFDDIEVVHKTMRLLRVEDPVLVHGGASGADEYCRLWAEAAGWKTEMFGADWDRFGKGAGPRRNQAMVNSGLGVLVAFPGGRGTEDMVRRAREAGILTLRVEE
jgi:hypothetical protein